MRRGFTLIEAMLAIVILAMVATMAFTGVSQTSRARTAVENQADQSHVVRISLERMVRELSAAYVSSQVNINPSLQVVKTCFVGTDGASQDRIDFTSFSHQRLYRDAPESDQNELSYFVTRHPDDATIKVLARREQSRIDDDPRRGGKIEILVENVEELELDYLDGVTRDWVRGWDTTQVTGQPNRLPLQVRIRLAVKDSQGRIQRYGTRAVIPLTWGLNHATYNP